MLAGGCQLQKKIKKAKLTISSFQYNFFNNIVNFAQIFPNLVYFLANSFKKTKWSFLVIFLTWQPCQSLWKEGMVQRRGRAEGVKTIHPLFRKKSISFCAKNNPRQPDFIHVQRNENIRPKYMTTVSYRRRNWLYDRHNTTCRIFYLYDIRHYTTLCEFRVADV